MVKYADRGLVENGSVSSLFGTLYLLVYISLFSVLTIFAFFYILNQDRNKKSNFHLMCMGEPLDSSNFESIKSITLVLALTLPLLLSLIFMYCSIQYYLHSRGISKKIPAIIGKFRRNILSLKETFAVTIIFFVFFYLHYIVLMFNNQFGLSSEMLRIYLIINGILINVLLEGIIWPIYILWNLHEQMPEFFSSQKFTEQKFNIFGNKILEPRRLCDNKEAQVLYLKKINQKHKFKLTSMVEMPEIE